MTKRPVQLPQLIQLRLSDDLAKAIDEWRRAEADIPTRSEAIRRLLVQALGIELK